MSERVTFKTSDGVEIVGDYYPGQGKKFAILLHMMPATKESWKPFAVKLGVAGYDVLAIDERGHGESTMSGTLDYKKFGEKEQQAKIHDVDAAFNWLQEKGAREENTVLIGASIGANLTIQFLSEHAKVLVGIALSPGLNYRGVTTNDKIMRLHPGQKIVLVASDDDDRDSAKSCRELHRLNPSQTVLIEKKGLGHGTDMTEREPKLIDDLLKFLP